MCDRETKRNDERNSTKSAKRKVAEEWKNWMLLAKFSSLQGHYMSKKQEKLWAQYERDKEFEPKKSNIFSGVCIFVNGYTNPPAAELRRLMQQHGGDFHLYETSRTTHVIASNLCYSKLAQVKPNDKIMKPEWIIDSIKEGRLLPEVDYLLIKKGETSDLLKFLNPGPKNDGSDRFTANSEEQRDRPVNRGELDESGKSYEIQQTEKVPVAEEAGSSGVHGEGTSVVQQNGNGEKRVPTASDPDFVKNYYSRSRLHFIATWAQEMKNYVNQLKAESDSSSLPGIQRLRDYVREKGLQEPRRMLDSSSVSPSQSLNDNSDLDGSNGSVFMHLDMDCFFVSVGLRKRPELRGQPVAVAHSSGFVRTTTRTTAGGAEIGAERTEKREVSSRSEIASCSYEARAFGLRNGMLLGKARNLCPNLKTIPYDFEDYYEVSKMLYEIVGSYTLQIDPVSCDEVYLDITTLCRDSGASPLDVATVIRRNINERCQCPSSAGIGPNMLVARLATRKAKPNGQYQVTVDEVSIFMAKQKLSDIPGVGFEANRKLQALNVETCEQLRSLPLDTLRKHFGVKTADQLYNFSKGVDKRKLKSDAMRKSVSCDMNYGIRFAKKEEVHQFLTEFAGEVVNRLKRHKVKGRMITLKLLIRSPEAPIEPPKFLGCGMCDAVNRSTTLSTVTDDCAIIAKECIGLFDQISPVVSDLRGIGVSIHKLEPTDLACCRTTESNAGSIMQFVRPMACSSDKAATVDRSIPGRPEKEGKRDHPSFMPANNHQRLADSNLLVTSSDLILSGEGGATKVKEPITIALSGDPVLSPSPVTPSPQRRLSRMSQTSGELQYLLEHSNYEDTKKLVVEWVVGSEEPVEVDIAIMSKFFARLIEKLELHKVRTLLALLLKVTSTQESQAWRRAYEAIVNDIQHVMRLRYGCPLRVWDD